MKRFLLLLFFLGTLLFRAAGQPAQTARAEILLNNDFHNFRVWPQPDGTLVLLKIEKTFWRNSDPFTLITFNSNLEMVAQNPVPMPKNSRYLEGTVLQKTAYLLFEGQRRNEYRLARINTSTNFQTVTNHFLPENQGFRIGSLQALDGNLFISGFQNGHTVVFFIDPAQTEMLKIPAIYDQSSALSEFQADTISQRAEFILSESNGSKGRLQVKRLAPDGRLFSLSFLQDPQYNYLAGRLSPGDSSTKLLAGTYSYRDLRYAQGFFAGNYIPGNNEPLQYHDFTTFSHYFDYLRPARQEKLKRKVARLKATDKLYQFRQRLLLHRLYPMASGFLLVGELYFPHYQNEGTGRGAFDGYQFTQVLTAAVDKQGNLLWENSFPLQDIRTFTLQEMVTVGVWGEKVILGYPEAEKLWYKEFGTAETTPNDSFISIIPPLPSDKVYTTYPEGLAYWYNQHFITYGVQHVRGLKGSRTVFYLNKVSF